MSKVLVALAAMLLTHGLTVSAQQAEVMTVVKQFVDGFNKGDVKSAVATCAAQTSVVDEFAPYEWHGAGACSTWANAYDADAKTRGITDGVVTLGTPRHFAAAGDRAYVVIPATYDYKQHGKPVKQAGSLITIALQKGAAGWKMTAWTWSTN